MDAGGVRLLVADREAARAREDEDTDGEEGEDARGVFPACGEVEWEFGGTGGMICAGSSPEPVTVLGPLELWLERGEWLTPTMGGTCSLTRGGLIDIDGRVVRAVVLSRGYDAMNALSESGGGVGR